MRDGEPRREQRQRQRADQQHGEHDVEQPLERAIALGEHAIAGLLDDDRAAHLVAEPDRMRRRLTITALPSAVRRRSVVRMPASAPSTSRPRGAPVVAASSLKSSVGCSRISAIQRMRSVACATACAAARDSSAPSSAARFSEPARAKHAAVAVDDPDARRRPRQALHDLRDLRRRRRRQRAASPLSLRALARERRDRVGRRREEPRPVVQRGRHRLRGARPACAPARRAGSAPARARTRSRATAARGTRSARAAAARGSTSAMRGTRHSAFQR